MLTVALFFSQNYAKAAELQATLHVKKEDNNLHVKKEDVADEEGEEHDITMEDIDGSVVFETSEVPKNTFQNTLKSPWKPFEKAYLSRCHLGYSGCFKNDCTICIFTPEKKVEKSAKKAQKSTAKSKAAKVAAKSAAKTKKKVSKQ